MQEVLWAIRLPLCCSPDALPGTQLSCKTWALVVSDVLRAADQHRESGQVEALWVIDKAEPPSYRRHSAVEKMSPREGWTDRCCQASTSNITAVPSSDAYASDPQACKIAVA